MSCIDQEQTFTDAAVFEALLHLGGDIDEGPTAGDLKPEFLAVAFHALPCTALKSSKFKVQRLVNKDTYRAS